MDGNVTFRSAVMGGFNREDVMNYIERTTAEHRQELEGLREQIERCNAEMEELRAENEGLRANVEEQQQTVEAQMEEIRTMAETCESLKDSHDRAEELARELDMTKEQLEAAKSYADQEQENLVRENEQLKAEKAEMEQVMEQAKERLEEQGARISEQSRQIKELMGQTSALEQNSEAYQNLCGRIGQIEMEMRFRTLRMEQETKETMQAQAEAARATYAKVVDSANEDALEVRQKAQEQLEQFQDDVSGTSAQVSEAVAKALAEVNTVRELLEKLDSSLGQRMAAVNEIQLGPAETKSFTTKVVAQAELDVAAMDAQEAQEAGE